MQKTEALRAAKARSATQAGDFWFAKKAEPPEASANLNASLCGAVSFLVVASSAQG